MYLVYLVYIVYLVCPVYLVYLVVSKCGSVVRFCVAPTLGQPPGGFVVQVKCWLKQSQGTDYTVCRNRQKKNGGYNFRLRSGSGDVSECRRCRPLSKVQIPCSRNQGVDSFVLLPPSFTSDPTELR